MRTICIFEKTEETLTRESMGGRGISTLKRLEVTGDSDALTTHMVKVA